jgi:hypothetical protein
MRETLASNNAEVDEGCTPGNMSNGGGGGSDSGRDEGYSSDGSAAPVPEVDPASAGGAADASEACKIEVVGEDDKLSEHADGSKGGDAVSAVSAEDSALLRDRRIPPRDMKRLHKSVQYKVVEMDAWGGGPVLVLEDAKNPSDRGRYKLPWKHAGTAISVGDTVELLGTGFSESRNLTATEVLVRDASGEPRPSKPGVGAGGGPGGKGVRRRGSSEESPYMAAKRMRAANAANQRSVQLTAAANVAQMRASVASPDNFTFSNAYLFALMNAHRGQGAGMPPGIAFDPEQFLVGAYQQQHGMLPAGAPLLSRVPFQQLSGAPGAGAGAGVRLALPASGAPSSGAAAGGAAPLPDGVSGDPAAAALSSLAHINAAAAQQQIAAAQQQMMLSLRIQQENELANFRRHQELQAQRNGGGHNDANGASGQPQLQHVSTLAKAQIPLTQEQQMQQLWHQQQMLMMQPSFMYGAAAMHQHAAHPFTKTELSAESGAASAQDHDQRTRR